ncbi:MAG: CDP-alcohol phosphatidyltransferase family protein [Roseococcus sp.]|jgi:phosphatidylglycerophosphate synthase|uniref:CDP-alcohol phosphatidyltransferase family protein n=1 Tax=Rubritepida flocculans TaxID=182403 RepID=UPI000421F245|nr:CDP-alcohol phosphatidyltransferase family protein [Rubritepida flocculans]
MTTIRRNKGLLAGPEAAVLDALTPRLPAWVTPDRLSALGVLGAGFAGLGFAFALDHRGFLLLACLGLVLNWLGDSLDGRLARHRGIERPAMGFLLDNGLDTLSYFLFATGYAVSGLVWAPVPFILLALYYMLANLALARLAVTGVFDLSVGAIGTTEIRAGLVIVAGAVAVMSNAAIQAPLLFGFAIFDLLCFAWMALMIVSYLLTLRADVNSARRE